MTSQTTSVNLIIDSCIAILASTGLNGCSVDAIASRSGCAKGLMNYHFRSKDVLLRRAAERLRDDRHEARMVSVSSSRTGTAVLDDLWQVTVGQVESGLTRAWLALLSNPATAGSVQPTDAQVQVFLRAVGEALGIPAQQSDLRFLLSGLEGFEVRLLSGAQPLQAKEGYDRFWLAVLNDDLSQA